MRVFERTVAIAIGVTVVGAVSRWIGIRGILVVLRISILGIGILRILKRGICQSPKDCIPQGISFILKFPGNPIIDKDKIYIIDSSCSIIVNTVKEKFQRFLISFLRTINDGICRSKIIIKPWLIIRQNGITVKSCNLSCNSCIISIFAAGFNNIFKIFGNFL